MISELNSEDADSSLLDDFSKQLAHDLDGCDALVLSHEFLFQNPYAIKTICQIAKATAEKILIIGYSRRQSDFMVSAYSQWLFRSSERIAEATNALNELGINPVYFTGLERHLMASVQNDFHGARQLSGYSILDWNHSYGNISKLTCELGATLKCGMLPDNESCPPLIQDFCAMASLTLLPEMSAAAREVANPSFDQSVIEAISNAVAMELEMPGPHQDNDIVERLSSLMPPAEKRPSTFQSSLKSYVDSCFWEANRNLCRQYALDEAYFRPAQTITKQEILEIIATEAQKRVTHHAAVVENYRALSARMLELCVKLARENRALLQQSTLNPSART